MKLKHNNINQNEIAIHYRDNTYENYLNIFVKYEKFPLKNTLIFVILNLLQMKINIYKEAYHEQY